MPDLAEDFVILDLRDEKGRFFCRPRIPMGQYKALLVLAKIKGISFEEVIHFAISEYAAKVMSEKGALPTTKSG